MKTVDIHALVEEISQTVVFADITELDTLSDLPKKFSEAAEALNEIEDGKISKVLLAAADIATRLVAGEDSDPESLALLVRVTSALQACSQDGCPFETAGFPVELGGQDISTEGGEVDVDESSAAPDLEINLALVDEMIVSEFLTRQGDVIEEIEKPIMALEQKGSEQELDEVLRFFHTIKGESGLLGLTVLADLCHAIEDMLQKESPTQCVDRLLAMTDWIRAAFKYLSKAGPAPVAVQKMYDRLKNSPASSDPITTAVDEALNDVEETPGEEPPQDLPAEPVVEYVVEDYTNRNLLEGDVDLTQDFIEESVEHLDAAEVHLLTLESSPKEDEALNAVFRGFHTIKGLAGFIELDHVQEMAHKAENLLDMARKNEVQLDGPIMDIVFESVDMMKRLVEGIRDAIESDGYLKNEEDLPNLIGRLIVITDGPEAIESGTVSQAAPTQVDFEDIETPSVEDPIPEQTVPDITNEEQPSISGEEDRPPAVADVQIGKSGFIPLGEIKKSETKEDAPVASSVPEDKKMGKSGFIPLGNLKKPQASTNSAEAKPASAEAKPASAEAKPASAVAKPASAVAKPASAEAKPASAETAGKSTITSKIKVKEAVRVDAERLDRMVDTIGELVIAETMVSKSPELSTKLSVKLAKDLDHLDKICRELQEIGMSLRMVPVRPVFQKMARLVRDLGKKSGREIKFTMAGEDTELDKNVVDKIGDPLVHMIRNAVDHGIEGDMDERMAAGKNDAGTVQLRAFHKGGNICIEIEDDGRGLNRDAILAKAIDRGLIREGDKLSDREIYAMIFEPGFSTAKQVTDLSGRGVGMDVVRRNIEELRGLVDISSTPGKGSVFSIKLPLTLAIIEGMVVTVGNENYIIPTLSVVRLIRPNQSDISRVFDRGEMLAFEGEYLPLFRLSGLFEIENARHNPCEAIVVIVEDEGKKVGLVADTLLGQQSIVIKSLGDGVEATDGVAGGAILSDGNVALILDVGGLVRISHKVDCAECVEDFAEESTEATEADTMGAELKTASLDKDIIESKTDVAADAAKKTESEAAVVDREPADPEIFVQTD